MQLTFRTPHLQLYFSICKKHVAVLLFCCKSPITFVMSVNSTGLQYVEFYASLVILCRCVCFVFASFRNNC